jgi:hypothetical protein
MKILFSFILLSFLFLSAKAQNQNPEFVQVTIINFVDSNGIMINFNRNDHGNMQTQITKLFGTPDTDTKIAWTWEGRTLPDIGENLSIRIQEGYEVKSKKYSTRTYFEDEASKAKILRKHKSAIKYFYLIQVIGDDHQTAIKNETHAEKLQNYLFKMGH